MFRLTILALVIQFALGTTFFINGLLKLGGQQQQLENFERWKLPDSLRPVTGWFELVGAMLMWVGLWLESWAAWGGIYFALFMLCAMYVHIRIKDKLSNILSPLVLAMLALFVTWLNRAELLNFPF